MGIIDTPPTPSRVKDRNVRNQGVCKDRCTHGQGALSFPSPLTPLSQSYPSLTGGPALRTSQYSTRDSPAPSRPASYSSISPRICETSDLNAGLSACSSHGKPNLVHPYHAAKS